MSMSTFDWVLGLSDKTGSVFTEKAEGAVEKGPGFEVARKLKAGERRRTQRGSELPRRGNRTSHRYSDHGMLN